MTAHRPRYPLHRVNAVSTAILALTLLLAKLSCSFTMPLSLTLLVICWFLILYFSHCLAHYVTGRLLGIKFRYYTLSPTMLSRSFPFLRRFRVFLTLRLAEKPEGWRGFVMFTSGALASMLSPLLVVYISRCNPLAFRFLLSITLFNIIFTGYFSSKQGCISKGLKCLKRR